MFGCFLVKNLGFTACLGGFGSDVTDPALDRLKVGGGGRKPKTYGYKLMRSKTERLWATSIYGVPNNTETELHFAAKLV